MRRHTRLQGAKPKLLETMCARLEASPSGCQTPRGARNTPRGLAPWTGARAAHESHRLEYGALRREQMLRIRLLDGALGLVALFICACSAPEKTGPDLILTAGRIYASAESTEPVSALAIADDRIVALGTDEQVRALATDFTQEMDLGGAPVLPGFHDAWVDLEAVGRRADMLDLTRTATPREVQARLRAASVEGSGWIVGWGWDETMWPSGQVPDRHLLDGITDTRPVLLYRRIGRVAWLNGTALATTGTTDQVLRDVDGNLTGLLAGAALQRAEAMLPTVTSDQRRGWIIAGLQASAAAGFTSVSSAPLDDQAVELLVQLAQTGDLQIHVRARLQPTARPPDRPEADNNLQITSIGLDVDGPLALRLAAVSAPYADASTAAPPAPASALEAACDRAAALQLPLDTHLRGDAAIIAVGDCAAAAEGLVVGADILPPGADVNARHVAIVPHRMAHDLYWLADRIGAQRASEAHSYRDLARAGKLVAFATRAPAFPLDPMGALWIMNRRQDLQGYPLDGWNAPQRLSVRDSLRVALADQLLRSRGLTIDAKADLVVWSADPFDEDTKLPGTQALIVLVGGRVIFSRPTVP